MVVATGLWALKAARVEAVLALVGRGTATAVAGVAVVATSAVVKLAAVAAVRHKVPAR